jgi:uncharacterized protein YceK
MTIRRCGAGWQREFLPGKRVIVRLLCHRREAPGCGSIVRRVDGVNVRATANVTITSQRSGRSRGPYGILDLPGAIATSGPTAFIHPRDRTSEHFCCGGLRGGSKNKGLESCRTPRRSASSNWPRRRLFKCSCPLDTSPLQWRMGRRRGCSPPRRAAPLPWRDRTRDPSFSYVESPATTPPGGL